MAQVDFSNAVLDVDTNKYPLRAAGYMRFNFPTYGTIFKNARNATICSNLVITTKSSLNQTSFVYTGTFTESGTEFYIGSASGDSYTPWKVSNVSFSAGDTFSFAIDIDVSIV